jgi:hypothetical protein
MVSFRPPLSADIAVNETPKMLPVIDQGCTRPFRGVGEGFRRMLASQAAARPCCDEDTTSRSMHMPRAERHVIQQ